jgi:DNA-binding IclR family transcriptional regulator
VFPYEPIATTTRVVLSKETLMSTLDIRTGMTQEAVPGTVKSDFTLFEIQEALLELDGAGVTELARHLDRTKTAVHKHLKSLETAGYVHNDDGEYELTLRYLEFGGLLRDRNRIYRFGRPKAETLARETGELVMLAVRDGNRGSFLFRTSNRYRLQNVIPLGERPYLHQNAAGRAMLAEFDDDAIDDFIEETGLPRAMEKTITDPAGLWEEIEQIREDGFAIGRGERFQGIQAVATAITDAHSDMLGSLIVVIPEDTAFDGDLESVFAEDVVHAAREISLELSHSDPAPGVS